MNNPNTRTENVDHKEDRLSNLPDDVLTRILSHMKMKEVVRSGILSKRWKSVWLSVPTLVLLQSDFILRDKGSEDTRIARFSNFVFEMLIARKFPSLKKVSINCCNVDHGLVKLWVQAALERGVSELELTYSDSYCCKESHSPCELTHNLFSNNKLDILKLEGYIAPNFPCFSSCFPRLKKLELNDIFYRDCYSLPDLLSSCPVLENMTIARGPYWISILGNTGTLIITSSSLKTLTVCCHVENRCDPFFPGIDEFKMVIDAPAVEYLYLQCHLLNEYVVKNLSSLVKADLVILDLSAVLEILRVSPQLQILNLDTIKNKRQLPEMEVPSCLLKHLKTINTDLSWLDNDIEKVRYFLINSKVLERMKIHCVKLDESLKLELRNVILESAADSFTWTDIVEGRESEIKNAILSAEQSAEDFVFGSRK